MNAGTDREIGEFVREVWVQTPTKPEAHPVGVQYYYRHTTLSRDAIVARVTLAFERGDPAAVRAAHAGAAGAAQTDAAGRAAQCRLVLSQSGRREGRRADRIDGCEGLARSAGPRYRPCTQISS